MKILYLDESGNHDMGKIDPDYPVFVLGGVIVEGKYAVTVLEAELSSFKLRWFGSTKTVLHTADITRNRGEFEMLIDAETRARFYDDLNAMMRRLDYSVVACVVDKYGCAKQRKWRGVDAYTLALEKLIESFYAEIGNVSGGGEIVAERRLPELDRGLTSTWNRYLDVGTSNVSGSAIKRRIRRLDLRPKSENIAGLQLADLVVSPIGRHVIGKQDKEDWWIVDSKVLNAGDEKSDNHGLMMVP